MIIQQVVRRSARCQRYVATVVPNTGAPKSPVLMNDVFEEDGRVWRRLNIPGAVQEIKIGEDSKYISVNSQALRRLARVAITDIQHFFRRSHLQQLSNILKDPEASDNDRFVAFELLKNACVSAAKVLPSCQDTGTATIIGLKGHGVLTDGGEEEYLSQGVYDAYIRGNLRYSQVSPVNMFAEKNTRTNLPAQIDIFSSKGYSYEFMFVAKGGGSGNKTKFGQESRDTITNEEAFAAFITKQLIGLGTAACPPYHFALVIGGTSPEQTLKAVKLASTKYLDPITTGSVLDDVAAPVRDVEWEKKILSMAQKLGIGAQFGGKYFLHDVRVIRLPAADGPINFGLGVSCSADRQALAKITADGVFIEQLEYEPAQFLPDVSEASLEESGAPAQVVKINLNMPMADILATLSKYPVKTRVALSGSMIVARDIAHARLMGMLESGKELPDYIKKYPVYYAGPAKTPDGLPSGSFGPTTAGRMDIYVDKFQENGASMVMIGKGNRGSEVTKACKTHGGFYLGSIGGVAAQLTQQSIQKVEVLDFEDLGMEAVWKIDVEDFPAFIICDDKGNDFFHEWLGEERVVESSIGVGSVYDPETVFESLDSDQTGGISVSELAEGTGMSLEEAAILIQRYHHKSSLGDARKTSLDLPALRSLLDEHPEIMKRLQRK